MEPADLKRLQQDLVAHGITVGISRIRRIREKPGIRCKQTKKFKAATDSRHTLPVAENLLEQNFKVPSPNWVSRISLPMKVGSTVLQDLFNGEIVGYALCSRITKDLVMRSLYRAVATKKPETGFIHHSDRGSRYCSREYK